MDNSPLRCFDGFVPDAPAEKILSTLASDERADVLRAMETIRRKSDISSPNAVLTTLVNRKGKGSLYPTARPWKCYAI